MENYKKMYFNLFNAITDALDKLEKSDITSAMICLAAAQCRCEEIYMQGKEFNED